MRWLTVPLKEIAPAQTSRIRFSPDEPVWHLTLDQIESHTGYIVNKKSAAASEAGTSSYVFDDGNVLYSKLRPYLNKVLCPTEPGIATTELVPLKPCKDLLDRHYLTYYLRSHHFLGFANLAVAGVKMPRMIMAMFWKHQMPLPLLSEQRRIVEILDQADALRRKHAEADAKAARILPALFYKMFGDPATNPKGWQMAELANMCVRVTDGTHQPPPFTDVGIPFLFVQNIVSGAIDFGVQKYVSEETYDALTKYVRPERGDILYSTVGTYGVAVEVDTDKPFVFQRHIGHIKPNHQVVDATFLCAQLNTPFVRSQADQRVRGIAQKTLNLAEFRQFKIIVPPLNLQRSFSIQAKSFHALMVRGRDLDEKLGTLFSLLLQRAFTGDLTSRWREAHTKELLAEMHLQRRYLEAMEAKT